MTSSDQSVRSADDSLEHARKKIDERRERTARRREKAGSPLIPAMVAAYVTYLSFQFLEEYRGSAVVIGAVVGWAVGAYFRRST